MNKPPSRPPEIRKRVDEVSFTRNMRFEIADAEGRALLWSYVLAGSMGLIWLLMVWFGPSSQSLISLLPPEETPVEVKFE